MTQPEHIGLNRTGIHMSPLDSRAMQDYEGGTPDVFFDDAGIANLRNGYILDADLLGSVPLPVTLKGAAKAGAAALRGERPHILLDKLGERLAFERTGTRLYDALITKCEATLDGSLSMSIDDLQEIRDDEARHFLTVAQAIEALGGDATSQTPSADLVGVESMGLVQVVNDPRTTIAQSLHALLTAELADQVGWESLIALAEEQEQFDMVSDFTIALDEERGHLLMVQSWYEEAIGIMGGRDGDDDLVELPL
ncbi:ferritin-like domain-containing protein [Janthinobacterium fluminis]|uniref:Ferritin-like domain-containing protein n=1 Tax=Janthinobacterium fluminis TaxID=2987524 RepID=A0ABT5K8W5_9BURK|nr:ferritin-like domain-containing protein [Janthinobacterium fluminis]MDC8760541.1 ferritin-like domain-containing protein [Janthinobacterium fluminis]